MIMMFFRKPLVACFAFLFFFIALKETTHAQSKRSGEISEAIIRAEAPPAATPPTGVTLSLAQTFQLLNRSQLGVIYWTSSDFAFGLLAGFNYGKREYRLVSADGSSNLVQRVTWDVLPEVVGIYTIAAAKSKRLVVSGGIGPYIKKQDGAAAEVGYAGHVGPGVDWPLSTQLSLHFEEWIGFVSDPDPAVGFKVGLQPQLSILWWF